MSIIGKKVVETEAERTLSVRQEQVIAQMSREGEYALGQKFKKKPVWVMADDAIINVNDYINQPLVALSPMKRLSGLMIKENKIAIEPNALQEKKYDNIQAVEDIKAAKEVQEQANKEIAMAQRKIEITNKVNNEIRKQRAEDAAKERELYEQKY